MFKNTLKKDQQNCADEDRWVRLDTDKLKMGYHGSISYDAIKFKRFKSNSKDSNSIQTIQIQFKRFKLNSKVSTYFSLVALSANVVVMQMH